MNGKSIKVKARNRTDAKTESKPLHEVASKLEKKPSKESQKAGSPCCFQQIVVVQKDLNLHEHGMKRQLYTIDLSKHRCHFETALPFSPYNYRTNESSLLSIPQYLAAL